MQPADARRHRTRPSHRADRISVHLYDPVEAENRSGSELISGVRRNVLRSTDIVDRAQQADERIAVDCH